MAHSGVQKETVLCVRITLYSQSPLHLLAASSQSLDSLITTSAVTFRVLATLTAVVIFSGSGSIIHLQTWKN